MKTLKIILFSILGIVLSVVGLKQSKMRKKAAKYKAVVEKEKHKAMVVKTVLKVAGLQTKINLEKGKKKQIKNLIRLLEDKQNLIEQKLIKEIEEVKVSENKIKKVDLMLDLAKELKKRRKKK